eukprot:363648-Chlamydomonas_euryale.AAC.2
MLRSGVGSAQKAWIQLSKVWKCGVREWRVRARVCTCVCAITSHASHPPAAEAISFQQLTGSDGIRLQQLRKPASCS